LNVRKIITIASFAFLSALTAGRAQANGSNQAIKVNFSGPVQVPGTMLPAGTYWFVLVDDENPAVVQILNAERSKSYGFFNTISRQRPQATSDVAFKLAKQGEAQPEAVVAWFYPGRTLGHEFAYSARAEKELAKANQGTPVSGN
jgi:hypothetical protein